MADGDYVNKNVCRTIAVGSVGNSAYVACSTDEKCSEAWIISDTAFTVKASSDEGTDAGFLVPAKIIIAAI